MRKDNINVILISRITKKKTNYIKGSKNNYD